MARSHKAHGTNSHDLGARIERTLCEERFQNALELARQHFQQSPTNANRTLLHRAALGRVRELRRTGATRDAATILDGQLHVPGLADWMKPEIAEELALCGRAPQALALLGAGGDPALLDRILGAVADAAVQQQNAGRGLLPATVQPDFDRILNAFALLEAGQDDAVREALQPVGLRSPFLEWKVYLRGLQAYYVNDDARALENWQRLRPERLPARLAAPLRLGIDPAFQAAQPPQTQAILQRQAARLQGNTVQQLVRDLGPGLAKNNNLAPVFRQAEQVVKALKREAPHLVPRLAHVFYWAILSHGQPEDMTRYQRLFDVPADDPQLHRLEALALERCGDPEGAHKHWSAYEKEIASRPKVWPPEQAGRARALILLHMGRNAASIPSKEIDDLLPPFLRDHPSRPRELKPGADECFRQAIDLAPDQPEAYRELLKFLIEKKGHPKAIALCREILKQFPDDVPLLTGAGQALLGVQKYDKALEAFQRALTHNPLDRTLRRCVGTAHLFNARSQAEEGQFDRARQSYQASLEMDPHDPSSVLCKWAACEIKAGDAERGEELIQKALAGMGSQLAVSYSMVIESIRLQLPPAVKKRFDASFKQGLTTPVDPEAAMLLAETTAVYESAGVTYHGQKTHQKKVLDYLKKAEKAGFTEEQIEGICEALIALDSYRLALKYLQNARITFTSNPLFPLLMAELELNRSSGGFHPWQLQASLKAARELAERLPHSPKRDALLDRIQFHQNKLAALNPMGRMFEQVFDPFGADEDQW